MKVLILSTFEQTGGAARSAHRLFKQLKQMNVDCRMLVQYRTSTDSHVIAPTGWMNILTGWSRPYMDSLPILLYRSRLSPPWSLAWLSNKMSSRVTEFAPDIIHLHGIGHGFLSLADIQSLNKPIIWTLHDSWAFTGGCHLPGSCVRYSEKCGYCPQLNARHECDLSRWGWLRKAAIWPKLKVTFITPSHWLAGRAASSSLLRSERIDVIPNGVDTSRFTPCDRVSARAVLSVSDNETVLLYGATSFTKDTNKGFYLLLNALKQVIARFPEKKLVLALFGDSNYNESEFLGIPIRSYGQVSSEEQLVNLYGSADFFVLPSLQENLPNTVMEAMACGTPCVAFDVGGVGDLICHGENGYVVKEDSANALAGGIEWMLTNPDERKLMGRQARQTITANFALASIADSYLKLYDKVATGD